MDNRPPPPQGPPPSYAFVTRMYKRSLRPVVISVAFLAGLWSLFAGIGFFKNVSYYFGQDANALGTVSIVLGAVYMLITVIEAFGIFAAVTQRLGAARIFAWLSAFVILCIAGIGLARVIIHFTMKNQIINTCIKTVDGGVYVYSGFWGPISSGTIDTETATDWCNRSWDRGSWSEIIAFLATTFLAALFSSTAFGFYRQLLDPSSVANAWRAPATGRADIFPSHYAPPFNAPGNAYPAHAPYPASAPAYGGGYQNSWAPPPGPPPPETKPPGYEGWGYGAGSAIPSDDKDPFRDPNSEHPQRGDR